MYLFDLFLQNMIKLDQKPENIDKEITKATLAGDV